MLTRPKLSGFILGGHYQNLIPLLDVVSSFFGGTVGCVRGLSCIFAYSSGPEEAFVDASAGFRDSQLVRFICIYVYTCMGFCFC